jgi:YbbR domain-containing protein
MRDLLIKDWGWKLFSLFLAVAIWLTVHKIIEEPKISATSDTASTLTYGNLPVLIVSTAADVRFYRVAPTAVKVTVSGSQEVMAKLQSSQVRAVVDLTDIELVKDWHRQVEILMPPGVTLISVEPQKVVVMPPPKH